MGNGSKRQKLKKALSPVSGRSSNTISPPNPPPGDEEDHEDLMDQLMAELDSKDTTTQTEAATVLNEMNVVQAAENGPAEKGAKDSKARYKARQVQATSSRSDSLL